MNFIEVKLDGKGQSGWSKETHYDCIFVFIYLIPGVNSDTN